MSGLEFSGTDWFNDKETLSTFHRELIFWGKQNFRIFPWRESKNPYDILIAEIMLHRTQASQALEVYKSFIIKYPTIKILSKASLEDLYVILYPLGLKWRIDRLYEMIQVLKSSYDMQIPKDREALLSLPGISKYITNAVRCFAWDIPEPLADTNTIRIVGRLFALEVKPSSRRNKHFEILLSKLLSEKYPASYNYALLDLADKICKKKTKPECSLCPILKFCVYGNKADQSGALKGRKK